MGGGAIRFDQSKNRLDLIPPEALWELGLVYTYGTIKYEDNNWRKGMSWSRVFGSIMRHCWKFWWGEEFDKESGLRHMAMAAWNCMTLLSYCTMNRDLDDRPFKDFNVPVEGSGGGGFDLEVVEANLHAQWQKAKEDLAAKNQTMEA